jgi:hypothetical protein
LKTVFKKQVIPNDTTMMPNWFVEALQIFKKNKML